MQKIFIVGRLGREPEMRYTPSGQQVTNFSVATDRRYTDRDGEKQTVTTWFNCEVWGKLAEVCNEYLHKGNMVNIVGRMKEPRCYQSQDGNWRAAPLEVVIENIEFLTPKGSNGNGVEVPNAVVASEEVPF